MIFGEPSKREKEVLKLVIRGYSLDEIAKELSIAKSTVVTHKERLFTKYVVNTQHQLVGRYYRLNLNRLIKEYEAKEKELPDGYFIEYIKKDFIQRLKEL